jgi:magnesium chelatase family protein
VLDVLRQPLEEGLVRLARANHHVTYPCQVMLVAAMNPCPCGYFNVTNRQCSCAHNRVLDYHARVSGPLLDRIDISLETRAVDVEAITRLESNEKPSAWYRARVEEARARQLRRFEDEPGVYSNAQMGPRLLARHCRTSEVAASQLKRAVGHFALSARAHDRILRLARTRADLEGHDRIEDRDMHFAIGCRVLDRRGWLEEARPQRFDALSS